LACGDGNNAAEAGADASMAPESSAAATAIAVCGFIGDLLLAQRWPHDGNAP
jgi:hypothetical protein